MVGWYISLTDDNIAELGKNIWDKLLNDSESEHCSCTFAEYIEVLQDSNVGFDYQLISDTKGGDTIYNWQTSTMKDNFDTYGGILSINTITIQYVYVIILSNIICS